jgi:hypothetical protein
MQYESVQWKFQHYICEEPKRRDRLGDPVGDEKIVLKLILVK